MNGIDYVQAVQWARQGNQDAIGDLYTATYREAYGIARHYVKNEENALDVLQAAYVTAFENLDRLQNPAAFGGWLNTIVKNRSIDYMKKKTAILFSQMGDEGDDPIEFEDDRAEGRPDAVVDYQETKRLVREILDSLSDEQRLVTLMYYFNNMPVKEIAAQLECPENTVKSRLNYARQKIKGEVLALEKKGTKLYSLAPIPFFVFALRYSSPAAELPAAATLLHSIQAQVAAKTAGTAAGAAGAAPAVAAGAKAAGHSLATKIAAGAIAAALAVGGGVAAAVALSGGFGSSASLPASSPALPQSHGPGTSAAGSSPAASAPAALQAGAIMEAALLPAEVVSAAQQDALALISACITETPDFYPSMIWILNAMALDDLKTGVATFAAPELVQTVFYAADEQSGNYYLHKNYLCFTYRVGIDWPGHPDTTEMYIAVCVPNITQYSDGNVWYDPGTMEDLYRQSSLEKMQKALEDAFSTYISTIL